jgi:hypothetical protein
MPFSAVVEQAQQLLDIGRFVIGGMITASSSGASSRCASWFAAIAVWNIVGPCCQPRIERLPTALLALPMVKFR